MANDVRAVVRADGLATALYLKHRADLAPKQMRGLVRHFGQLTLTRVKANASTGFHAPGLGHIPGTGPGPNVATSTYLRSITMEVYDNAGAATAVIGTSQERGRRLELGFVGTDSAGRTYPAARRVGRGRKGSGHARKGYPYPHFMPAARWVERQFLDAAANLGQTF